MIKKITLLVLSLIFCATAFSKETVKISNNRLSVSIATLGAELQSIKDKNGVEYLWQGDSAFWGGRAPNMFPVCVKFKDQKFTYKGKQYQMPDMGLAKITNFKVIEKKNSKVVLEIKSNKQTLEHYPFLFVLQIAYQLQGNKLLVNYKVENTGHETMYYALGGHPGFRFPFEKERANNQYVFDEKYELKRTEIASSLVQDNQIPWLNNEMALPLGDKRIPNAGMFIQNMPSRSIGVGVVGQPAFIELNLEDFPNVNLWSPPGMPYACIEPMVAHHDLQNTQTDIENKNYLEKLQAGETKSYSFSIVVKHNSRVEVSSFSELIKVAESADPGTLILLSDGIYSGDVVLKGTGTPEAPLVIAAKKSGNVTIEDKLKIEGENITVSGLKFTKNGMLEILGSGCRVTNCKWDNSKSGKWLRVLPGSSEIEIDHNTFQNKVFSNQNMDRDCQLLQIVVRNKNESHHIHHNLFKNVAKGKTGNGFETLQLITENNPFDPPAGSCNTVIEDNLFLRCNGEAEIISIKSNGNIIRKNTFSECRGGLVLRHGDDNIAMQNYFLGGTETGSAGIRIQGTGQIVASNYFQDLGSYGLGMMDGTPDNLYIRVERAKILFNSFINCNKNFVIGINHSKHPNGTVPKDCKIVGNIFYSDKGEGSENFIVFVQDDQPENWLWKSNIAFGEQVPKIKGILIKNPELELTENNLLSPTSATPSFKIINNLDENLQQDLVGKKWQDKRTIGAIQYPFEDYKNKPLVEKEVGAGY